MKITVNEDTLMHWKGCLVKAFNKLAYPFDEDHIEIYDEYEGEYKEDTLILMRDEEGEVFSLSEVHEDYFEPVFPRMGYRNLDKTCFFLSRSNQRTYRKGISKDITSIFFPQHAELESLGMLPDVSVFDFVDQGYPSLSEAKEAVLSKNKWAVAFHRHYAFVLKVGSDRPVLYYKYHKQGYLNADGSIEFLRGEDKFNMEVKYGNIK